MVNTRSKAQKILHLCSSQSLPADSGHQHIPSAAVVGSNDDLLTQILLRVPIRAVLRFKSVSKQWYSLITHPRFTLVYNRLSTSPGFFLRTVYVPFDVENPTTPPFRVLDFYLDLCGIRILQSCNGLLLCCSDRGNERARKYYVFNPTTKQFAVLPSVPGGQDVRKTIRFMALSFDETESPHFRVVCFLAKSNASMFQIKIYSSDTKHWTASGETFFAPYYMPFQCGVYWNGAIHWAPSITNPLYFNLDVERLKPLPMPSSRIYQDGALPLYFGVSRGHLHLVERDHGDSWLHLNVYEMEGDCSGWFVKYRVELDELPGAYPEMVESYLDPLSPYYYQFEIFGVVRGEKEEDTFMVVKVPGKIIRYDIVEKSFKQIFELDNGFYGRIGNSNVHQYIESLASF